MRNYSANLARTIKQLYEKATSAVQMNGSMVENNSWSNAKMSSVTHPRQHFSRTDDALEEYDGRHRCSS